MAWTEQPSPQWATDATSPPRRLTPLTLADVLDGMFRLVSSNWRVYLIALGSLIIPFNIISGLLSIGGTGMIDLYAGLIENPNAVPPPPAGTGSTAMVVASGVLTVVQFAFVTPVTWALSTVIAAMAYQGVSPQPREVWRAAMRKYGTLFALELLLALVVVGAAIILALLAAITGGIAAATGSPAGLVVVLIGLLFGALWLTVKLSLCVPAIIVENAGPGQALGRSWSLTRGRQFWRALVTWLVAGLILVVLTFVFTGGFAAVGALSSPRTAIVAGFIGWTIVGIVTTPLFLNAALLLYYDIRIRTEAYDLEVMTQGVVAASYNAPGRAPLA